MTVTYTHEVADSRLGGFSKLLLRWRGSVYKLFYKEFIIYISLYVIISIIYRTVGTEDFRQSFEKLCLQFQSYTDLVPISFVLGFYVSMVVGRWWCQYENIPWPDRLMVMITSNVHGSDNRGRLIRRTLLRYVNLSQVLTYRSISTAVYKRFPTIQHVIDAGFMTTAEYKHYENVQTENIKYWVPCVWFANLLSKARQERRIYDDMTYQTILKEMNNFRGCCGMLFSYDWISIPLVYTQVVTVAVYAFFMSTLLSRQYLDVTKEYPGHEVDLYVPIFTICQFFFYVGWLKVAEQLINPFGEDDDDFEVNSIIDRNFEVSMLSVDNMYMSHPKLERDIYWNNPNPSIPYTAAAVNHKLDVFLGSTIDMRVDGDDMQFVNAGPRPSEETQSKTQLDCNHNTLNFDVKEEQTKLLQVPPYESTYQSKQTPRPAKKSENSLTASIKKHFASRNQEKEREAKKALLSMDFLKSRNSEHGEIREAEEKGKDDENDSLSVDDSDDGESDVGDGSEDDDMNDSISQRRSSLSSEDGAADKEGEEAPNDSQRSLGGIKHSIDEPEDRPKAKKAKSNLQPIFMAKETVKSSQKFDFSKLRRPDKLVPNENDPIKMVRRGLIGRGRKSPKKKTSVVKFLKRNEFPKRSGGETEEERKNAQDRTLGLLKSSRKKSVQALQRNARRVHYPGNAWLRHRYPGPSRFEMQPYFNATDYTSMTSGAEEQGKAGNDSPFGSVLSFGTSIPSPKPLRFSYNAKRGKSFHPDNASMSSCLPSPYANEDFGSSPMFESQFNSPKSRQDWFTSTQTHAVSMPYTEDIRKRLLVVNTNTPSSSTATSPVAIRAQMGNNYHNHFLQGDGSEFANDEYRESDNLLMIAPFGGGSSMPFNPWKEGLEAIGENPTVEKEGKTTTTRDSQASGDHKESGAEENPDGNTFQFQFEKPTEENFAIHELPEKKQTARSKRNIARSKSCPDVPISKILGESSSLNDQKGIKFDRAERKMDESSSDEDSNEKTLVPSEEDTTIEYGNEGEKTDGASSPLLTVHWENERQDEKLLRRRKGSVPSDGTDVSKSIGDQKDLRKISEVTPLLQSSESITDKEDTIQEKTKNQSNSKQENYLSEIESSDTLELNRNNNACKSGDVVRDQKVIEIQPPEKSEKLHGPISADQGYYSAKEDSCAIASITDGNSFVKLRNSGCYPPADKTRCRALSGELLRLATTRDPEKMQLGNLSRARSIPVSLHETGHQSEDTTESSSWNNTKVHVLVQPISTDVVLDMI